MSHSRAYQPFDFIRDSTHKIFADRNSDYARFYAASDRKSRQRTKSNNVKAFDYSLLLPHTMNAHSCTLFSPSLHKKRIQIER
jgi:hypothetical protein